MNGRFRTHSPYFVHLKYILHTDVILEGDCYGKLAVYIRTVKIYIRISSNLANPGGQVQVGTYTAKVDKFG